jgi:hypothetical protein
LSSLYLSDEAFKVSIGFESCPPAGGVTVVVLILVTQIGNTFGGLVIFEAIRGSINRGF